MLQAGKSGIEQVEILDERGVSVGQVVRPTDPRPLGPAKGTVYLQRGPVRTEPSELPPAA
jgi:hypothetical protein